MDSFEMDTSNMNSEERAGWSDLMEFISKENPNAVRNNMENSNTVRNVAAARQAVHPNPLLQSASSPALTLTQPLELPTMSNNITAPRKPYIRIVEQPTQKKLRFRYLCEGRSAGSIPGANSTPGNKTFPAIEIVGYTGKAVVVVSCVTKDKPYRPHPHNLVGRDGNGQKYKKGICEVTLNSDNMRTVFSNMGIQCARIKDIESSLEQRKGLNVNPFNTEYSPKDNKTDIDLNVVRLCFQAYIKPNGTHKTDWEPLDAQVSEPIYDKKAMSDLVICQLCSCSAKVTGGDRIILLCEKVLKDDIKIKFSEVSDNEVVWRDYGVFQQSDVHRQTAIAFKTPRYKNTDVTEPVKVFIQLERPSDGALSEPLDFDLYPDPGMRTFTRIRRKIKRKEELDIFQQILSLDSETTLTKYSCPINEPETCADDNETVSSDSSASKPNSLDTLNEYEAAIRRCMGNVIDADQDAGADDDADTNAEITNVRDDMDIEFEVPHINYPVADESTQTSTPMEEILKHQQLPFGEVRALSAVDKITEWMRSSEFERTDSLTVENGDTESVSPVTVCTNITCLSNNQMTDEDKTFTELMEQVAELDDMLANSQSRRGTLDNPSVKELPMGGEVSEVVGPTASAQPSLELDETFDETATYTSLQIAYKNPVELPSTVNQIKNEVQRKSSDSSAITVTAEEDLAELVVLTNPPAPKIKVNTVQTPPSPRTPPLPIPPRTPSPGPERKVPPLPPKRRVSHELDGSNNSTPNTPLSRTRNGSLPARPSSQIIIMRTPEQSPTKRQSTPTPTASPKKKQGFFARLFSRKSKTEIKPLELPPAEPPAKANESKTATPAGSREPSIGHFSLADPKRASVRSAKSLQPNSPGLSPHSSTNASVRSAGKPVTRSASSVSGKRPAHLNADVIHIPLKGDGSESGNSITTFGRQLDRKTLSALQLADIPVCDGNMELVAIADRQSIKNLCEGDFGIILDPSVDLSEAEHFALYTSVVPPPDAAQPIGANDNIETLAHEDTLKRKRFKPEKLKAHMSNLTTKLQNQGFLYGDTQGQQFQMPITPATNMWQPNPDFTVTEFKAEPITSPEHFGIQNSPYMMHSPIPDTQQSPNNAMGMQYTNLQPYGYNTFGNVTPTTTTSTTINTGLTTLMTNLPSTSGGSFTLLSNEPSTQQNMAYSPITPTNDEEMGPISEGTLVNQIAEQLSNSVSTLRNLLSNTNAETANESELPFLADEPLTTSDLIIGLDGEQLLAIANLSVTGKS